MSHLYSRRRLDQAWTQQKNSTLPQGRLEIKDRESARLAQREARGSVTADGNRACAQPASGIQSIV